MENKIENCTFCGDSSSISIRWRLDRVNDESKMLRVKGNTIVVRDLHWWERLLFKITRRRLE